MTMISRTLAVALLETVQLHADQHQRGTISLDKTLSALGDVTSGLLAELTTTEDRRAHYDAFVQGVASGMTVKILNDQRSTTRQ
jgi:hypothetical protein